MLIPPAEELLYEAVMAATAANNTAHIPPRQLRRRQIEKERAKRKEGRKKREG